jgi:UDP-4-amino-4,6-dideoxy-N-acetyl-beta-L-altrosamine transaminase
VSEPTVIPYGRHAIDQDDITAVLDVLRSDWLTSGPTVGAFEQELARRCAAAAAVSCANGTAALHLSCLALGLGPYDTAIVPAITFVATANAARMVGAEVVFADVDPDSGLMEASHLAEAIERTIGLGRLPSVALPVHLGGQCADIEAIAAVARAHDMAIIEDACHALGTVHHHTGGRSSPVGACAYSDLTVFSFHPVKTIACGEGGALTARDEALAQRARKSRSHGIERNADGFVDRDAGFDGNEPNPWYYEMVELGFNYRLSDINCALALSQLRKLDRFAAARAMLAQHYDRRLAHLAPAIRPIARSPSCTPVRHLYAVLIDFSAIGMTRGQLMRDLRSRGVGSQVHYIPVPRQPYYRHRYGDSALPGADAYYRRTLSLPYFVGMTTVDVDRVIEALTDIVGR